MKTTLALLLAFLTLPALADDIAGHYVLSGVMEVGSELWLKPDGNFEWMLAYGAADYWAKGAWHRDGNAVILQSSGHEEAPFRLLRSEAGKPGRIRVWVMGKNGKGVEHITVYLQAGDKPLEATTDSDGAAVFPDAPDAKSVSFEIRVYETNAGPFPLKATDKDYYYEIDGDAITQVLFKNERLAIDGNNLVMTHFDPNKPMRYEKQ